MHTSSVTIVVYVIVLSRTMNTIIINHIIMNIIINNVIIITVLYYH